MQKSATLSLRVDPEVKSSAEDVLSRMPSRFRFVCKDRWIAIPQTSRRR